jgi:hypothetical protein
MRAVRCRDMDVVVSEQRRTREKGISWLLLCASKEVTRSPQARGLFLRLVIPAKAGIQRLSEIDEELDPGFRRDDELTTQPSP